MRILPEALREPTGIAYLLARTADTIADTAILPSEQRLAHIHTFRAQLAGDVNADASAELGRAIADVHTASQERELLHSLPEVFALFDSLQPSHKEHVRSVVLTLTQGMEMDLTTFPAEDSGELMALQSQKDLDEYTYYVAGCVGEFWTSFTMEQTPALRGWDEQRMCALAERFGKALQMTNILRDLPKDLRIGRCYIPQSELTSLGLCPHDLLNAANEERGRTLLVWGIRTALEHFRASEQYITAIPRRCLRLRLAALWPVLIGLATLIKLVRSDRWLSPGQPVKIPRRSVYIIMAVSLICGRSNRLITLWIRRLMGQLERAL